MNNNIIICNNCGKQGHMLYHCKLPIISYGIIVFRKKNEQLEYLMIRRKDTYGYIDFVPVVQGKKSLRKMKITKVRIGCLDLIIGGFSLISFNLV